MSDTPERASSLFAQLVQRAAALSDAYDDHCVHCRRMTKWVFTAVVAGRKQYACARCGCVRSRPQGR